MRTNFDRQIYTRFDEPENSKTRIRFSFVRSYILATCKTCISDVVKMNDIQVQVGYCGIKRVFITPEPQSYIELISFIRTHIYTCKAVLMSTCTLFYENDEGDFVVLPKGPESLAIAIKSSKKIPGVNMTRFKLKVSDKCTSPSTKTSTDVESQTRCLSGGMKELSPGPIKSPEGKRCRLDAFETSRKSSGIEHTSKKKLSFPKHFQHLSSDDDFDDDDIDETESIGTTRATRKTPLDNYIEKIEISVAAEEESLRSFIAKRNEIAKRIEMVKNYPSHGNLCRKCHLCLGHTARNCSYGQCSSVFSCGKEKFHSGELNTKEMDQS